MIKRAGACHAIFLNLSLLLSLSLSLTLAPSQAQSQTLAQDKPIGFASLAGEGSKQLPGGTTGGAAGQTVTVTTQSDLEKYAAAPEPYTIHMRGTLAIDPKGKEIRVASHKSILGLGDDATLSQGGFALGAGTHNVIIRNLTLRDTYVEGDYDGKTQDFDGIQMDSVHHVWIDHCRFDRMGDGMVDSRKDTDYLTLSWNKFTNHNKTVGIGWTENVVSKVTLHHNWFQNVNQRNPSCDNAYCHLFNNFLEDVTDYGNFSRGKASMVVENSVFRNVQNPWFHDPEAKLTAIGNLTEGNISGKQASTGDAFDPKLHYNYTLDPANQVKALVMAGAGPKSGVTGLGTRSRAPLPESVRRAFLGKGRIEVVLPEAQSYTVTVSTLDGRTLDRFTERGPARRLWPAQTPGVYLVHVRKTDLASGVESGVGSGVRSGDARGVGSDAAAAR